MVSYLHLRVLSCHAILVEPFAEKKPSRVIQPKLPEISTDILEFELLNANTNGEFMPVLLANSVAFNLEFSGDGVTPGVQYNRYNAQGKHFNFFVANDDIDIELSALMTLLHKPEELVKMIKAHHKRTVPLPWDNQEEYGKIHRTLELIKPIK